MLVMSLYFTGRLSVYRSRAYITERRSKGLLQGLEIIGVQGLELHQGRFG